MIDQPPNDVDPQRQVSAEAERARALAAVMRDQAERAEAVRQVEVRRGRHTRLRRGALLVAWAGIAYVWLGNPSWLRVAPPPQPTIGEEAQALRFNVFLQTQQIEAYRSQRGRLPYVLEEAGPPFQGMEYRRRDSRSYEVSGVSDRVHVRYTSEEPALDFVGSAAGILTRPGERGDGP